MKCIFNFILFVVFIFSLCIIFYVRLGVGFPIWHAENYQNFNIVIENLSYSFIAGVIVYLLTIVLPDWWEARRLKPIVDMKIAYLSVLFNRQIWGIGAQTNHSPLEDEDNIDCTKIDQCIAIMDKADWNAPNPTVSKRFNNKVYQTYKQELDIILQEIADILQTYKSQLTQSDIKHLENIRQNNLIPKLVVLYDFDANFPPKGHDFIIKGHREILEEYNQILRDRKIILN